MLTIRGNWQRATVLLLAAVLAIIAVVLIQSGGGDSTVSPIVQGATETRTPSATAPADPGSWLCGSTPAEPVLDPASASWAPGTDPSDYGCVHPAPSS